MIRSAFVDMLRLHWNITAFGKINSFGTQYKTFDSIDCFKIQYVFGNVKCNAEYCNRKALNSTIEAIIVRCVNLYKVGQNKNLPRTWLDFKFEDIFAAEILLHINDCSCSILVMPIDFYD